MTSKKPTGQGGPGRGQGRKPAPPDEVLHVVSVRMTRADRAKLESLGGLAWVRAAIKNAKQLSPKWSVPADLIGTLYADAKLSLNPHVAKDRFDALRDALNASVTKAVIAGRIRVRHHASGTLLRPGPDAYLNGLLDLQDFCDLDPYIVDDCPKDAKRLAYVFGLAVDGDKPTPMTRQHSPGEDTEMIVTPVRLSMPQRAKFAEIGSGAWLRARIRLARGKKP